MTVESMHSPVVKADSAHADMAWVRFLVTSGQIWWRVPTARYDRLSNGSINTGS